MAKREPLIPSFHLHVNLPLNTFGETDLVIFEKIDKKRKCLLQSTPVNNHIVKYKSALKMSILLSLTFKKCLKVAQ